MNLKYTFALIMIIGLLITGCNHTNQKTVNSEIDIINNDFSEAKQEVMETFGAVAQSIKDGD